MGVGSDWFSTASVPHVGTMTPAGPFSAPNDNNGCGHEIVRLLNRRCYHGHFVHWHRAGKRDLNRRQRGSDDASCSHGGEVSD